MAEKICSIRTDEETLANFKELCKQFDNQSECLQALINLHELSNSKKVLSGQQSSIDDFQSRVDGIVRAYINALDMNANAEERIRQEFAEQLNSKDKIIITLQERSEQAENSLKTISEDCQNKLDEISTLNTSLENENAELHKNIDIVNQALIKAEHTITDKQMIIDSLTAKLPEQEELEKFINLLNSKIDELSEQNKNQTTIISDLNQQITDNQEKHNFMIQKLKSQHEIDIKQAVLNEKEKNQEKSETLNKKILELQETIFTLRTQINELSIQNKKTK
jgi:chromosome segregation ATPase